MLWFKREFGKSSGADRSYLGRLPGAGSTLLGHVILKFVQTSGEKELNLQAWFLTVSRGTFYAVIWNKDSTEILFIYFISV